ncbi:hypothetical protein HanPSC8_Chr08g0311851 [Helianthus annuus]|nr:hypothetical protein HanPSC8_Chr08g0311851 [Helianthus annuus]
MPFSSLRFGQICDFRPKKWIDENGKISSLLNPDAEKQTFGRKSQTGQTLGTKMAFYSKLNKKCF